MSQTSDRRREGSVRDHLANERTLLAWIRTSITLVGLGFLVGRLLAEGVAGDATWGVALGALLVLAGCVVAVAGLVHFRAVARGIQDERYRPAPTLYVLLSGGIALAALLVFAYLLLAPPP